MIRYGIIGAGRMGNAHASQTRELKGTSVSAVYDIRPEAAEKMHADYGARICGSANELASAPEVDCVIVTSPTYCHQEGVRAAVAANTNSSRFSRITTNSSRSGLCAVISRRPFC